MSNLAQNAPVSAYVGAPAFNPYSGKLGYVVAIDEPAGNVFTLAGGMRRVRVEYVIAYPDGISTTADNIAAPWIEAAAVRNMPACPDVDAARAAGEAAEAARRRAIANDLAAGDARREAFKSTAAARVPAWAQAAIYAVHETDDCDSMSDYCNVKKGRVVILGFSPHKRDLFPELRKAAATFAETADLADAPASAEHREKYSMGGGYYLKAGNRYSTGWKVCKRPFYRERLPDVGEWLADLQPEAAAPVAAPAPIGHNSAGAFRIERHAHTKGGFDMWLRIPGERVDRDTFDRQRDAAKAGGGWWSRPWGKTPGGFAFKSEAAALAFSGGDVAGDAVPAIDAAPGEAAPVLKPAAAPAAGIADKLRDLAEGMESAIRDKFADRRSNTPKQQRQAAEARNDGRHLQRAQKGLLALAAAHDAGTVPAELAGVRTKAAALELAREAMDYSGRYYDAGFGKGKPANDTPAALAFWRLAEGGAPDPEAAKAEELRRKIDGLRFANIPGYFPTPAPIVATMLQRAGIEAGARVLEPSAGSGNIADAIRDAHPGAALACYERHATLAGILRDKGHDLAGGDFMGAEPDTAGFDAVVMNPPFESGQDMAHVRHAFRFLKPGGRLVAIMSPGPFFRSDAKAAGFRAWFEAVGGEREDLPAGAFKESGTGVATVLCVIDR